VSSSQQQDVASLSQADILRMAFGNDNVVEVFQLFLFHEIDIWILFRICSDTFYVQIDLQNN